MHIIKAKYEIINEPDCIKKIERMARICYKSESKIGEKTGMNLVKALITNGHTAMLEHADIAIEILNAMLYHKICEQIARIQTLIIQSSDDTLCNKRIYLRTSECKLHNRTRYIISGNIRAWFEFFNRTDTIAEDVYNCCNERLDHVFDNLDIAKIQKFDSTGNAVLITDYSSLTNQERVIHETMSVIFTVDRGVTHELVRMRDASFAQESTRYCNYANDKFNNEITVIGPCFEWTDKQYNIWKTSCEFAEKQYFALIDTKAPAQQARDVLPTSVKADIGVTATLMEWYHIFNLRACDATGPAHPQMSEIMRPLLIEAKTLYETIFDKLNIPE